VTLSRGSRAGDFECESRTRGTRLEDVTRHRLASALFAVGSLAFLWIALGRMFCGSGCALGSPAFALPLLGLAVLHGALAVGVWRGASWARWMGIGVGFTWVLTTAMMFCAAGPLLWLLFLVHAPMPLLLARPDRLPARTSISLLLAGMALPLALGLGLSEATHLSISWANVLATACVAVGAFGLARERTWGLLLVGGAGLIFFVGGLVDPVVAQRRWFEVSALVALPLLAAMVPFAEPIAAWLRRD